MSDTYPFVNTPLPYEYDALESYIDAKTMELHHNRHLQSYIDKLNSLLKDNPQLQELTLTELIANWYYMPPDLRLPIRQNAGGIYNHRFYFDSLSPAGAHIPDNEILNKITSQFGSYEEFMAEFKKAAMSVFGSGYAWLVEENGKLHIITTANQNTPITPTGSCLPILNIDLWEHAYYLKHYNLRGDYIDDWFNVVDWNKVNMRYLLHREGLN